MGKNILGIESDIAWATPDTWTELNFGCYEGGENCQNGKYEDPFKSHVSIWEKLNKKILHLGWIIPFFFLIIIDYV